MEQVQHFGDYPVAFCYNYRKGIKSSLSTQCQSRRMRWQSARICADFYPDINYLVILHLGSGKRTAIHISPTLSFVDFTSLIVAADKGDDLTSLTRRTSDTIESHLNTFVL